MRHRSVESVIVVDSWEQELTTLCLENSVYSSCKTLFTTLVRYVNPSCKNKTLRKFRKIRFSSKWRCLRRRKDHWLRVQLRLWLQGSKVIFEEFKTCSNLVFPYIYDFLFLIFLPSNLPPLPAAGCPGVSHRPIAKSHTQCIGCILYPLPYHHHHSILLLWFLSLPSKKLHCYLDYDDHYNNITLQWNDDDHYNPQLRCSLLLLLLAIFASRAQRGLWVPHPQL